MSARHDIRALSVGARFVRCCLRQDSARVLSVHDRVINLTVRDELLALALPQAGGSSRFLCLNRLPRLAAGDGLRLTRTALVMGAVRGRAAGETRVGLEGVPLWEGPLSSQVRATPTPACRAAFADAMCRLAIPEAVQRALPGVARGGTPLTPRTATRLIGLGPGLTPAGDDVLLGYLAMDAHVGNDPAWTQAMHAAVAGGLMRTTTLSRQLLQNALEADYHETVQRVLAVVCGLSSENLLCSLRRLAAVGASSGACTVFGMWLALRRSVSDRKREPISREVTCTHCRLALQHSVSDREREPISREVTCTHCHSEQRRCRRQRRSRGILGREAINCGWEAPLPAVGCFAVEDSSAGLGMTVGVNSDLASGLGTTEVSLA